MRCCSQDMPRNGLVVALVSKGGRLESENEEDPGQSFLIEEGSDCSAPN
jgi:hypothetical protein